jgi:uncharacterized oxidoreductase
MNLKGKTILITGWASWIWLEASKQFLENWAKVIITGRNQKKLDEAKKIYPNLIIIKSDVSIANDVEMLFKQVKELWWIDILYNNAWVLGESLNLGKYNEKNYETAEYEININYLWVIRLTNIFIEMLKSRIESAIINTTSVLSYVPSIIEPTYSSSKAALRFYTDSLRKHLQIINSSVKVFELAPPLVATDMASSFEWMKAMSPEKLIKDLISWIKNDKLVIHSGDTKIVNFINKISPKLAFNLVNSKNFIKNLK